MLLLLLIAINCHASAYIYIHKQYESNYCQVEEKQNRTFHIFLLRIVSIARLYKL